MKSFLIIALGIACVPASPGAYAFDQHTHGAMTSEAIASSNFTRDPNASPLLKRLGLFDFTPEFGGRFPGLGNRYLDLGSTVRARDGLSIEGAMIERLSRKAITGLTIPDQFTITGWFMRGAIREDDNAGETPTGVGDEPDGVFNRVFGHFFDAQNDRGMTVGGVSVGARAVDWALQPGATVLSLSGGRENHYKVADARESMWRALTLKKIGANGALMDDVLPNGWASSPSTREDLRKAYWATTFRALGDSVHLIQDMAQPQHTRNDIHSGRGCIPSVGCLIGHDSFLEKYLRQRTLRSDQLQLEEGFVTPVPAGSVLRIKKAQLKYDGYPKPTFNSFADFFGTATGNGNASGKGLANYSNRGFYSFGTNIGSASAILMYPFPSPTGSGLVTDVVTDPELEDMAGTKIIGAVRFRTGAVQDTVTGLAEPNVKLAVLGAWDQFLQQKNSSWTNYTLNYYNYDDQARLLVPRAVGYSAGLIDYFFRGQLFVGLPAEGVLALIDHGDSASNCPTCGFNKVKVNVANSTPPVTPPGGTALAQAMTGGVVVAVAKYRRSTCYNSTLSQEYVEGNSQLPAEYYDGCIGQSPEEIVVSGAISVTDIPSCDAAVAGDCEGKARRMVFDFQQAIPVGAADIKLQVVYRGVLGSETDAVVVETMDVSEPSYYTFVNATDYIKLGAKVYTRDQIAASAQLIQQVKTECVSNGELLASCLQPVQITFPLRVGTPPPSPAIAPSVPFDLPVRTFARLAYLVPMGQTPPFSHSGSVCVPSNDTFVEGRTFQVDFPPVPGSPGTYQERKTVIKLPPDVRGVRSWEMVVCVLNGTNADGNQPDDRNEVMQALPAPGVPQAVSGFSFGT